MGCLHMGNLYETIHALCVRKGVTDSRMCTDIGISRGIMSDLKSGRKFGLSTKTLNKIAEYFSVSIDSIVGDEKTATQMGGGHSQAAEETAAFIDTLPPTEQDRVKRMIREMYSDLKDMQ